MDTVAAAGSSPPATNLEHCAACCYCQNGRASGPACKVTEKVTDNGDTQSSCLPRRRTPTRDRGAPSTAARVLRRKSKGSGGGLEPSATHASTALEQARPPSVIEIRGVARLGVAPVVAAHDAFGSLQSDAACGTRTRCGRSGWPPLSPPSRHPVARSPDCWRGGAPSTSGVTEPPGSGREHAPIATVGRRKKLDCRMGLTENCRFTVDVLQSSALRYLHLFSRTGPTT